MSATVLPSRSKRWDGSRIHRVDLAFLLAGKQEWDALAFTGKDTIAALDIAAKDKDRSVRMMAIRTLGRIGDEKAIPIIYRAIRDPDDQVRWEAVMASQKCGISPRYLPRALARRPRTRKNPNIAALLNFVVAGMGYFYLGKWWGILVFQMNFIAITLLPRILGPLVTLDYLLPLYSDYCYPCLVHGTPGAGSLIVLPPDCDTLMAAPCSTSPGCFRTRGQ